MKLFKRQCIRKVAGMSLKSVKGKFKFKTNIYTNRVYNNKAQI